MGGGGEAEARFIRFLQKSDFLKTTSKANVPYSEAMDGVSTKETTARR